MVRSTGRPGAIDARLGHRSHALPALCGIVDLSVRLAIRTFPQLRQTLYRILLMFAQGMVSAIAPIGAYWIMSQIDVLSVTYQPDTIKGIILLGFCFYFLLCLTHGYFYALSMWQKEQVESEALKNGKHSNVVMTR